MPDDLGLYDVVIVGAGSAGCVLANRLSADPRRRVLLLEAGGSDRHPMVHVPAGYLACIGNPRMDWMFRTQPEPGLGGRAIAYPRGKLLGGSSSINGMIYMRGQAADYDGWAQMGCAGWSWDDVLPLFRRSERFHRDDSAHGRGGELHVERQRLRWPILDAVREAAAEIGIPPTDDFNRGDNEGAGYFDVTQRAGLRWSAARAFLSRRVRSRPNLRVVTGAQATRIEWAEGRASAVHLRRRGHPAVARVAGHLVLSAGAIGTPHLLMLSGVGPGEHLAAMGLPVFLDLPGVGANLQDHLQIRTTFRIEGARTLNDLAASPWGRMRIGLEYLGRRTGPLAMAPSQLGLFTRSDPRLGTPDLEVHVQPLSLDAFGEPLHREPALTVSICNLRPESRGMVRLASGDPAAAPLIAPGYLSASADREVAVRSITLARRLMAAPRLARHAPHEVLPGPAIVGPEELAEAAGRIATTIFHPVGTSRMGAQGDPLAVVGPDLALQGCANVTVADASVMPRIVSGNTHAPVVMIAERASDLLGTRLAR